MALEFEKTDKLFIQSYKDPAYEQKVDGGKFTALLNPETYTYRYKIEFCETQAPGTSGVALKFNKMPAQEFNFDFLFDATGVIQNSSVINVAISAPLDVSQNVVDQLQHFKEIILQYQGDIHRPYYLKIHWGTLLFKGVLTSMGIEFKLFKPDGTPIRAIAKCSFKGTVEENLRVAMENAQSSDITHQKVFTAGDKLPLMTKKIYNDQSYYIEVAGYNRLDGFRKIKTGTKINFPPLD